MNFEQVLYSNGFVSIIGAIGFSFLTLYLMMKIQLVPRIAYDFLKIIGFVCMAWFPFLLIKNFELAGIEIPFVKEFSIMEIICFGMGILSIPIASMVVFFKGNRTN